MYLLPQIVHVILYIGTSVLEFRYCNLELYDGIFILN
jgi:hypothetical protein